VSGSSNTPFPLGVYVGGPDSSNAAANAAVEAQYAEFEQEMGATPEFMDTFIDYTQPIADWAANASFTAYSMRISSVSPNTIPVIGLPMISTTDDSDPDAVYKAIASGQYDSVLTGIVQAWAAQGYTTMYVRPGYEGNGSFMPWYAGSDPQTQADWVAAFQHIATVMRSVPGTDVKIVWSPNIQAGNTLNVESLYPGDQYVDVIAGDMYDETYPASLYDWALNNGTYDSTMAQWMSNPINLEHYYSIPAANQWDQNTNDGGTNTFSLEDMIAFAEAHDKPIGLSETGAGGNGSNAPLDDPTFVQWLAQTLSTATVPVDFVNIWDVNVPSGNWDFSNNSEPEELAAWEQYFGAYAPAITIGTGPDQIQLNISEDAWEGNAEFTISVDGVQIGGVQTATVSHAAGISQVFYVDGNFGSGQQAVTLDFLNDAYGGSSSEDRNLYLDSATYDGSTTASGLSLYFGGSQTIAVGPTNPSFGTLVLTLSEDAFDGNAEFSVSIDGVTLGSPEAVTAIHGSQTEAFVYTGDFGSGAHTVAVSFLNDAYAGPGEDRNLYVDSLSVNGVAASNAPAPLYTTSTVDFATAAQPDEQTLTVNLSEDAWEGDALARIELDGLQLGPMVYVTASHSAGDTEAFSFTGDFGAVSHVLSVSFLNDAYAGPGEDRNLYIDSVVFNGTTMTTNTPLWTNGTANFTLTPPTNGASAYAAALATATTTSQVIIPLHS
jgi:beta-mannanase